jgi:hypothetical protein
MSAAQFSLPYMVAFKPSGVGVPGAKMFFYAPGTTTKRPVYSTSALTTQLSNPVVADGAGRFPNIYLDNALTYKVVIYNKSGTGTPLYSVDPYVVNAAPSSDALQPYQDAAAASASAAATSATSAATNAASAATSATAAASSASSASAIATSVNISDVLDTITAALAAGGSVDLATLKASALPVNVWWFGAKGDGVTDDTAAIQAALNYLGGVGRGTLYFPSTGAFYKCSAPLTTPRYVSLMGDGPNASHIKFTNAGTNVLTGSGFVRQEAVNTSTPIYLKVQGLKIENTATGNLGAGYIDSCGVEWEVVDCYILGWKYNLIIDQSELVRVRNSRFEGTASTNSTCGILITNGNQITPGAQSTFTNQVLVETCQLNSCTYGIADCGGYDHAFKNNNYNGGTNHIYASTVASLTVDGGEFEGATGPCIRCHTTDIFGNTQGGNSVSNIVNAFFSPTSGQSSIRFDAGDRVRVEGNFFGNNGGAVDQILLSNVNFSDIGLNHSESRRVISGSQTSGSLRKFLSRAILQQSNGTGLDPVYVFEAGFQGIYNWSSADNSANVTGDPSMHKYVPPYWDATGASGAWVAVRSTGWAAATGTATRSTFATGSVTLPALAEHVKALIDDLTTQGILGT